MSSFNYKGSTLSPQLQRTRRSTPISSSSIAQISTTTTPFHHDGDYKKVGVRGPCQCPVKGCTLNVDRHIVSGDSVALCAHTRNLVFFETSFFTVSEDGTIHLEEDAQDLQLLLTFMHNTRQPDLSLIPFSQLFSFAEAAEKYSVYSAVESCRVQMECRTAQDPIGVWIYAVKYNYPTLANKAATLTLDFFPSDFLFRAKKHKVKDASIMQWHRFREQWYFVYLLVVKRGRLCEDWIQHHFNVIIDIGGRLSALIDLDKIVAKHRDKLTWACCARMNLSFGRGFWEDVSEAIRNSRLYSDCVEVPNSESWQTTLNFLTYNSLDIL